MTKNIFSQGFALMYQCPLSLSHSLPEATAIFIKKKGSNDTRHSLFFALGGVTTLLVLLSTIIVTIIKLSIAEKQVR